MSNSFLDAARQGRTEWSRFVLAILAFELFWWGFSGYVSLGWIVLSLVMSGSLDRVRLPETANEWQQIELFWQTPSVNLMIATLIPHLVLGLGIFLVVRYVHQRKFRTLISPDATINVKRLCAGFGVWLLLLTISTGIDYSLHPQDYTFTFVPAQWWWLLPVTLILTPIQTSTEEFLYRGYWLQGLGLITKQPILLMLITGILFAIPHLGNPEMQRDAVWGTLIYLMWGIFFAAITLRDNRLELALGCHAANNLFAFLFVNTRDSVLPTPAILTINNPGSPKVEFILLLGLIAIFYFVFFGMPKQPDSTNSGTIDSDR